MSTDRTVDGRPDFTTALLRVTADFSLRQGKMAEGFLRGLVGHTDGEKAAEEGWSLMTLMYDPELRVSVTYVLDPTGKKVGRWWTVWAKHTGTFRCEALPHEPAPAPAQKDLQATMSEAFMRALLRAAGGLGSGDTWAQATDRGWSLVSYPEDLDTGLDWVTYVEDSSGRKIGRYWMANARTFQCEALDEGVDDGKGQAEEGRGS